MSKILIIAPHADDEVLGVGGTIARLSSENNNVIVAVMTGHGDQPHPIWKKEVWDIVRSEAKIAHNVLGVHETLFREIPAALVSDQPIYKINMIIDDLIQDTKPDILFVPFLYDLHRDHREIVYAASVAWRPICNVGRGIKEIYMYETLSETHWNIHQQEGGFLPNTYFDISGEYFERKIKAVTEYKSQLKDFPDARSLEGISVLAKFRGCSVGVAAAEAFVLVRKIY
jgi:LmbE family N-acetylglucosaminyl deacetylase